MMIIFVKYLTSYHHREVKILTSIYRAYSNNFLLILCFHGIYSILGTVIILRSQQQNNGQMLCLNVVIMAYFTFNGLHVKQYENRKPYTRIWVDQ